MNWLDFTGASLSLLSTYYFTQARRLAWLVGIFAITLNVTLYWQKGIYGHLILEGIYFISMLYGWFQWSAKATSKPSRAIRYLSWKEISYYALLAASGIILMAQTLSAHTDSTIPYWDASTTILSLIAQWLLCIKIIHCWILWFIVDVLVALLQLYKGLPFHSAVHWLYLIMAVVGYYRWRKLFHQQTTVLEVHAEHASPY
ncbi:nicotinamide riboside transporter PnuC [Candidatus Berkiella aquae]|uniref:Nicotinamide riboside transporter PnuC n=1 Tax=Candidatus Berkiella aquae TaxID=295108 RepID=A0A0Q9YVP2_9GAMM|nr:nicotinamide riboside transporter PnuC [Candidatus Berkiella aquae]MCS5710018.1 nicotinamide riboside transporter PnuC [Candidatus Berkiella aquae]